MTIEEWLEEFDRFIEEREFLRSDDGDPDEYRKGYRTGYVDALIYVRNWLEETDLVEVD